MQIKGENIILNAVFVAKIAFTCNLKVTKYLEYDVRG